ncbi:MAG: hypothetical protein WAV32_01775 [Halobacteriota archaeon]
MEIAGDTNPEDVPKCGGKFFKPKPEKEKVSEFIRRRAIDGRLIREQSVELVKKLNEPEEFTKGLQELLKSYVDREATKIYPERTNKSTTPAKNYLE